MTGTPSPPGTGRRSGATKSGDGEDLRCLRCWFSPVVAAVLAVLVATIENRIFVASAFPTKVLFARSSSLGFGNGIRQTGSGDGIRQSGSSPCRAAAPSATAVPPADAATQSTSTPPPCRQSTHLDSHANNDADVWNEMARQIASCLLATDSEPPKELSGFEGTSTGWANWIDEGSALLLQNALLDRLELQRDLSKNQGASIVSTSQSRWWLKWMQTNPRPYVWDVSLTLRPLVEKHIRSELLHNQTFFLAANKNHGLYDIPDMLSRVSCRFLSIPSGQTLSNPLDTPVGTMVYGKVVLGGVERFRLLGSPSSSSSSSSRAAVRKAGQRTQISGGGGGGPSDNNPCWLQFGGGRRSYQALDMGPCLVFELALQPKRSEMALMGAAAPPAGGETSGVEILKDYKEMSTLVPSDDEVWTPLLKQIFTLTTLEATTNNTTHNTDKRPDRINFGSEDADDSIDMEAGLHSAVGGLKPQIQEIVRRVLDGRVFVPFDDDDASQEEEETLRSNMDSTTANRNHRLLRSQEMTTMLELGIRPVRGLLLYGRPGCGKTLLAREIARLIRARPPKIVAAPDLLDKWVGGTERLVRDLFVEAEEELRRRCDGDATKSSLHVLVIDECDALFRKRSAGSGSSSEVTRASAVNQILSKLDGIEPLDNILLIAMTNRRELLDPALIRPGRLEVQIECPLPDAQGRCEILQIQLNGLRRADRLSPPLVEAVYGDRHRNSKKKKKMMMTTLARDLWYRLIPSRRAPPPPPPSSSPGVVDLASDQYTGGFTGADLAGLVRCAGSLALARWRKQQQEGGGGSAIGGSSNNALDGLLVTFPDFLQALEEIKQNRIQV